MLEITGYQFVVAALQLLDLTARLTSSALSHAYEG